MGIIDMATIPTAIATDACDQAAMTSDIMCNSPDAITILYFLATKRPHSGTKGACDGLFDPAAVPMTCASKE